MKNFKEYFHLMFEIVFLASQKEVRTIVLDHKIVFLSKRKFVKLRLRKQASFVNKAPGDTCTKVT
jgi:hypothetical protein